MKLSLVTDGRRIPAPMPSPGCACATIPGACPLCKASPFLVSGTGIGLSADDHAYEARGVCIACRGFVGTLRVDVSTLFGLEEDERVARSGCMVY